jgi:phosphonate transport system substrate-binding protein
MRGDLVMRVWTAMLGFAMAAPVAAEQLTMGLIAPTSVEQTLAAWQPLADELGRELRMPVKLVASKDYAQISAALIGGSVQLAWLNNRLAIDAVEQGKAQVFAQMVRLDGRVGYKSLLLARADSPVQNLTDVLSRPRAWRLGLGDKKSVSGFLVPSYYLFSKNKIDPAQHFASVVNGSHRDNFLAVADGEVDVGVNNTEDLALFEKEMPARHAKLRVVWESPLIPGDPLLYRTDLPAAQQKKLRAFFTTYGRNESEKASLRAIKMLSGFQASNNYQLRPVVDLELFDTLTRAMALQKTAPQKFSVTMQELTQRAGRLDSILNASRHAPP